jgi:hypothetical protein
VTAPITNPTAALGATIWQLITPNDKTKELVQEESDQTLEFSARRVRANERLNFGDRVRVSIESPREGYLYVVDREKYADGSFGDPVLVFPTLRLNHGDARVLPGMLINIPRAPSYFRLIPNAQRKDQIAEILTIIVTSKPLDLELTDKALRLPKTQVEEWETLWAAPTERYEMEGGEGKLMTKAEHDAAVLSGRLSQTDPAPQTIYRIAGKPGNPLMVVIPLQYSSK